MMEKESREGRLQRREIKGQMEAGFGRLRRRRKERQRRKTRNGSWLDVSRGRCVMGECRHKGERMEDGGWGGTYDLLDEKYFQGEGF